MYELYNYMWFFIIYAFLGWCGEVAFAAIKTGTFVNRGFLNGPVCPIYGAGVCIVILCLTPFSANLAVLFIGSVILTSVLEFLTGFVLEKLYNEKWWDYSERPFNIKGYICLEFSLLWGVACVVVVKVIHPLISRLVDFVPMTLGISLFCIAVSAYLADSAVTFVTYGILSWWSVIPSRTFPSSFPAVISIAEWKGPLTFNGITLLAPADFSFSEASATASASPVITI